jgi:hypothetical protein
MLKGTANTFGMSPVAAQLLRTSSKQKIQAQKCGLIVVTAFRCRQDA